MEADISIWQGTGHFYFALTPWNRLPQWPADAADELALALCHIRITEAKEGSARCYAPPASATLVRGNKQHRFKDNVSWIQQK